MIFHDIMFLFTLARALNRVTSTTQSRGHQVMVIMLDRAKGLYYYRSHLWHDNDEKPSSIPHSSHLGTAACGTSCFWYISWTESKKFNVHKCTHISNTHTLHNNVTLNVATVRVRHIILEHKIKNAEKSKVQQNVGQLLPQIFMNALAILTPCRSLNVLDSKYS